MGLPWQAAALGFWGPSLWCSLLSGCPFPSGRSWFPGSHPAQWLPPSGVQHLPKWLFCFLVSQCLCWSPCLWPRPDSGASGLSSWLLGGFHPPPNPRVPRSHQKEHQDLSLFVVGFLYLDRSYSS